MKKFKILALVGIVGILIAGTLVVWAGVSALSYFSSVAQQAIQSPAAQAHINEIHTEMKNLPQFQAVSCWGKAQSLLAVQPWLERPLMDNLDNLRVACFEHQQKAVESVDEEVI